MHRIPALSAVVLIASVALSAAAADTASWVLRNPTGNRYEEAPVRLGLTPPAEPFVVEVDGRELAYQVQQTVAGPCLWVAATVGPETDLSFRLRPGRPAATAPAVKVEQGPEFISLDNGEVAVRLPARAEGGIPCPIAGLRLDGRWVGRGSWQTGLRLKAFSAQVTDNGPVFAAVRLRYEFDRLAGVNGDEPAYAQVTLRLARRWRHVEVAEEHCMPADSCWEFDLAAGWKPTLGRSKPFSGGAGWVPGVPKAERPLESGGLPWDRPELFINLFPRWNQHYKDGWFFAASDGQQAAAVMPVRAGQWVWPHDNALQILVRPSGDYAGVRCSTRHGRRLWWLLAGPEASPAGQPDLGYFMVHAFEDLDKINRDFILDWPGQKGKWFRINPYDSGQINPTGPIRRAGRDAAGKAGSAGNLGTLYRVQVLNHRDTYGSYWDFWSPENPNFFTDFIRVPVMLTTQLKAHPRFEELRLAAEMKVREDAYHTVTLPSGAGQECPGYMHSWDRDAAVCKQHLGFDPAAWPRTQAMARFLRRTSFPDGAVRRTLPMGDTHPGPDGARVMDVPADEVAAFKTEELAGFGAVFTSKPGTPQETSLAFKSGPNRGHYHGDALSFHYCADGRPLAVDHHCSYAPRAGQEHLHNRVAFSTPDLPWGNMDGYERLIAFKTGEAADLAVGQVESQRLRACSVLPPETWHQDWPQRTLKGGLTYRRTVLFVKGGARDYFVLRDQWHSADPDLRAAFSLHLFEPRTVALHVEEAGTGGATDGSAVFRDPAQDFSKLGVRPGWVLHLGGVSKGRTDTTRFRQERFEVKDVAGTALTLDRPVPAESNAPYVLLRPTYQVKGDAIQCANLNLFRAAPAKAELRFFPWYHTNGGPEATQGLRLETSGAAGQFITVLYPGAETPPMLALENGVKVGQDEITFGGGLDQSPGVSYVAVRRAGRTVLELDGKEINLERPQGDIGLFVPDAGYPFGPIPDWLIRQRAKPPQWHLDDLKRLEELRKAATRP